MDTGPEVVISGISGRYPESDNLDEFWKNLVDGVDMISEDNRRWDIDSFEMPRRTGKLRHLDKFDADYFVVHGKQADVMDPKLRITMELTHEALLDAGVNPTALRDSQTGVFVGAANEEALAIWKRSFENPSGYISIGTPTSMLANRVSFAFNFHGPSYTVDCSCAASSLALQNALASIKNGLCDSAIVAGVQTLVCPFTSLVFHNLDLTSMNGMCMAFDAAGSGYVRAEAGVVLYLCKKELAKRSYATVVHAKCNSDGYKEQGITFPSGVAQEQLLRDVYRESGVSPLDVDYVEAHGTGTKAGDPQELNAIANVFCEGREGPLLVGSVKSNMGHAEVASGVCGISKILLAHRFGLLPSNLHFKNPNPDIPSLHDGSIQVVDRHTPFNGKYASVNSFGFGGTNVHILLQLTPKARVVDWKPSIPVLIPVSGRTSEALDFLLGEVVTRGKDRNSTALLHEISKTNTPRHPFRGYALLGETSEIQIQESSKSGKSPIWFIFTGLGSQWVGMTKDMMRFKAFHYSIHKSAEILGNNNFDLMQVLNTEDRLLLEDLKNSIVSITAIQVALVDLLRSIGVSPDGIVGHSTGECASAYADGCFTHEQAVLVSLGRARAFLESNLPPGTVAAVGLTWEEATRRCPPGIYPAIHNSKENVTISGPPEGVRDFVKQLQAEGIFAKEVQSAIYGFHSPYVKGSEKVMRELLERVIPEPKPRSSKWLSSSIPASKWDSELAKYSSVDYHTNNALSPVHFYATLLHLPEDAVVLEIGPHCFMQTILKQALAPASVKLGLMSRHSQDNCSFFLNSVGKLYLEGANFDVGKLYEPVEFPVGPETPMISPWIKWDHSLTWNVPRINNEISKGGGAKFSIDLNSESDSFFEGHTIDGRIVFPATGYIWLVWKTFAQHKGTGYEQLPVVFENLRFERSTMMTSTDPTEFQVTIFPDNGTFEVVEGGAAVFRGSIRAISGSSSAEMFELTPKQKGQLVKEYFTKEDYYKELRLRGYEYQGLFQGIQSISMEGDHAQVEWSENWVSFLDTLLQIGIIQKSNRGLYLPIRIEKVTIDPKAFKDYITENPGLVPVTISKHVEAHQCPGIELRGMKISLAPRRVNKVSPTIVEHKFLPYFDSEIYTPETALDFCVSVVMDNTFSKNFIFTEILNQEPIQPVGPTVASHCVFRFGTHEQRLVLPEELEHPETGSKVMSLAEALNLEKSHLIYTDSVSSLEGVQDLLESKGFVMFAGATRPTIPEFHLVAEKRTKNGSLFLFKRVTEVLKALTPVSVDAPDYSWVEGVKETLSSNPESRVILVSKVKSSGILGLVKCLIRESGYERVRALYLKSDLNLNFEQEPLLTQMGHDLTFNVYQNGTWGCLANVTIPLEDLQKPRLSPEAYANAITIGDLSSLRWIESPLKLIQGRQNLCQVAYASLNFRDIMLATGKLARDALPGDSGFEDCVLGLEFSGIYQGKRVCGLFTSKCLATSVDADPSLMWEIPQNWTLAEAATIPVVFATAFYALVIRGGMKPGESVLIHAGSGGVGQAAIALALNSGCKVYTTVGSLEKREFLKVRFPQLKDENITDSRDARTFERHIREMTRGQGVDIVLNSLAQDKLQASIRCLGKYGRFLEIGKFDLFADTNLGMSVLLKSVNIQGILLDDVMQGDSEDKRKLVSLIKEGIVSGLVKPLPFSSFGYDQLEDAFRFMATGKHMGKVLIDIENHNTGSGGIPALPRTYFYPHKSYLIVGGLGGMGLEVVDWMIERGARSFVLNSRSGVKNSYQEYRLRIFKERGVRVKLDQSDVSTPDGAKTALGAALELGPVGGIFNTALVLYDALFENQSRFLFEAATKAKSMATTALDVTSRSLAPELDYFVVFSSLGASRGNPGQTNYSFANSSMERICEERRKDGLPALAIQWGTIGDVGAVHEATGALAGGLTKSLNGLGLQRISSWLPTLDLLLQQQEQRTVLASFVPAESEGPKEGAKDSLVSAVAHILAIKDVSKVNPSLTLIELGMDSLMATEIKQVLDAKRNIVLPMNAYGQLTFAQLLEMEDGGGAQHETEELLLSELRQFQLQPLPKKAIRKMKSLETRGGTPVFIVHPVDGTLSLLERLISQVEPTVYGFECSKDAPMDSIEGLATFYLKHMRAVQPRGPYKLAGYSFGSGVAFEMGLQLEREGERLESLLLLDGCPKWQEFYTKTFIEKGVEQDENSWLLYFLMLHMPLHPGKVEKELLALPSWGEKLTHAASLLKSVYLDFPLEEVKELATSFAGRLRLGYKYEPRDKLRARTVLIKSEKGGFDKVLGVDYGLHEVCHNKVEVIGIQGHHHSFHEEPEELGIPKIFNKVFA